MTKITKKLIADKIETGLKHYLTDQTSYGRFEDGLDQCRIEIRRCGDSEFEVCTNDGHKYKRFLIEVAEEI